MSAGYTSTCGLIGGTVYCLGDNGYGQLGNGTNNSSSSFVAVSGLSNATDVASGYVSSCAIKGGQVYCWGNNEYGQLGDAGTNGNPSVPTPVLVSGLSNVSSVAVADYHACALSGGQVYCWGDGGNGQLGNGSYDPSTSPVAVPGLLMYRLFQLIVYTPALLQEVNYIAGAITGAVN